MKVMQNKPSQIYIVSDLNKYIAIDISSSYLNLKVSRRVNNLNSLFSNIRKKYYHYDT